MNWTGDMLAAFLKIFVAIDAIGILPLFMGLTEGMPSRERRVAVVESILTGAGVAIGFIVLGKWLLEWIEVSTTDFRIAGGVILFVIASGDLLVGGKPTRQIGSVGPVPLGTPLIVGPAVLATSLILVAQHGYLITVVAILLNLLVAGVVLLSADLLTRILGTAGSRVVSKVASLILAAFAVMMVRTGVLEILATVR